LWLLAACAHAPAAPAPDPESIRSAVEAFHRRARWKDFRGAADLIVADRRQAFIDARAQMRDERDLTISDYELADVRLDPEGERAWVVSRISWLRLPSVTEQTQLVTTELVGTGRSWKIARQDCGPFEDALSAPYAPPEP
jgi:hypothetical protein